MGLYQGRALERGARPDVRPGARRGAGPVPNRRWNGRPRMLRSVRVGLALAAIAGLALAASRLPWRQWRERVAVVQQVRIEGALYLDATHVGEVAGLHVGDDLIALDLERARQALLLDPRISRAEVTRVGLRDVRVRIVEREPVLLVTHGVPWEVDSAGVLLQPLARGVTADVPLLTGPDFSRQRAGTQVLTLEVRRGLAWVRALAARDLQLADGVSEVDVSDPLATGILLENGTRVVASAWPPGARALSALRVVLSDLQRRGVLAGEVDLRFENQVVVRPVGASGSTPGGRLDPVGAGAAGADPDGDHRSG
jgi:cell division septal protein FtsQ